jgi:hypothetical protein
MSQPRSAPRRTDAITVAAATFLVICCAAPTAVGAAAGSIIGGWLGIVAACLVAVAVSLAVRRRRGKC